MAEDSTAGTSSQGVVYRQYKVFNSTAAIYRDLLGIECITFQDELDLPIVMHLIDNEVREGKSMTTLHKLHAIIGADLCRHACRYRYEYSSIHN